MRKLLVAAIFLFPMALCRSQEKTTDIDDIVISGKFTGVPNKKYDADIKIITSEEIKNSPATSIDEALQQIAGMDVRRRGANGVQADYSINGSTSEQLLILLNGIPMNDPQTGHNTMNIPVDLQNIDRIEIIKGPAAQRFGNNAYAGVINFVTKTSSEGKAKISASGGDFKAYQLGLSATFGKGDFSNLFQANTSSSAGYRHNTDYDIRNFYYQTNYKISGGKIGFQTGFSEKKFGANGFYALPTYTEQYEEMQAGITSFDFEKTFGKFSLNGNAYWKRSQDMYLLVRNKPSVYRNMHIGNDFGAELNASYKSSLGITGLGADFRKEFLVSSNLGRRNRLITQLFFEQKFSLFDDKLQLSPGISWANYSTGGNFFYPGMNAGFQIDTHQKIFGNVAKVHRVPTFTDLYYLSKTEHGNADLLPENALSAEIGYRYSSLNFLGKISGFIRNTDNAIDWIKLPGTAFWSAQNIGELRLKGFETEIEQKISAWLGARVSYTFIENKQAGNILYRYASDNLKHQLIAKADLKFLKNFTAETSYRYCERATHSSYNLLDEKLAYRSSDAEFFVLINNLTNTKYTETFGVPMPGRWFSMGASYTVR